MDRKLKHIEYSENTEQLALFAKALAHPVRIAILEYLDKQSCCLGGIVDIFPLAQSTVSQHLKKLKKAGLIQGELNPPKIKYCINQENWQLAKEIFTDFFSTLNVKTNCRI